MGVSYTGGGPRVPLALLLQPRSLVLVANVVGVVVCRDVSVASALDSDDGDGYT